MSKTLAKIALAIGMLFGAAAPVYGFGGSLDISTLPEYVRTNDIEISYSALTSGSINVQFCYKKEGESFKPFGPVFTTPSGKVQVTSSQMSDQMVKHYFRATLNGADCSGSVSDETNTILDYSGPSPVSNLKKESMGGGYYKLSWKNPHDPDFSRVFIYRSDKPSFTADGSTKVGEHGGAPNAEVSWDNYGLDTTKKYYYAVRAVDRAGNPSSIVGDRETVTVIVLGSVAPTVAPEDVVKVLPQEDEQVLGEESEDMINEEEKVEEVTQTPTPEAAKTESGLTKLVNRVGGTQVLTYVLLALGAGIIGYSLKRSRG